MLDPMQSFFACSRKIQLEEEESETIKCNILAFVSANPVRNGEQQRLTGMNTSIVQSAEFSQLSAEEKDSMFREIYAFMRSAPLPLHPADESVAHLPLFFNTLSGVNLLRYVKPFFLSPTA
jgi:hypothetical protein